MAKPKIVKGRGHVTAEKDDRASNSLPAVKKASPSPVKAATASNTAGKVKRSGSATAGRSRRPEKDDVVTPQKPAAFSSGPSTRGGARRTKTSTGPSTRGGARKSSVGTAGGGSSSRGGKRPEVGLVKTIRQKIRNGLGLGKSDGFSLDIKKYRKK